MSLSKRSARSSIAALALLLWLPARAAIAGPDRGAPPDAPPAAAPGSNAPPPPPASAPSSDASAKDAPPAQGGGQANAPAPADATPPAPEPPPPIDVSVHEEKSQPEASGFTRAESRLMPGAFGDPFRAIEALPGVVPLASGLPYFYVRGAPPGDVGYFLDGTRVPLLFHLGLGPAVIHPALIDKVELYPDGAPELGRFVGGLVSADLAAPRSDPHVEANVRVVDAGAFVEVPFADGRGDAMASGRYSYTGPLFSLFRSNSSLAYGDYAARASYRLSPNHTIGFFAFGAYDYLGEKDTDAQDVPVADQETKTLVETMFHRLDLRYDQRTDDDSLRIRHDVVFGWDQTSIGTDRRVIDKMLEFRSSIVARLAENAELHAGIRLTADLDSVDLIEDPPPPPDPECAPYPDCFSAFFQSRTDFAVGAYAELPFTLGDRFEITPSLRADLYLSGAREGVGVDPKVSTRTRIDDHWTLTAYAGASSQPPAFIVAGPGFTPPLDDGGLQRSLGASIGAEWKPDPTWTFTAAVYHSAFFALNDALGTSTIASSGGFTDGLGRFDERFDGWSTGLEISIKRRLTRALGGILSYTLGRAERFGSHGEHVPAGFDRTHVASLALSYDFGKGFRGGLKNLFYTGSPVLDRDANGHIVDTGKRLPPFYRFDFRAEKRFTIAKRGYLSIVLEMLNVFVAQEVIGLDCSGSNGCVPQKFGPVTIPSIGLEGGF